MPAHDIKLVGHNYKARNVLGDIREIVETLRSFLDFNYVFDATKPAGYPKRVMDISLARQMLGYNPTTSLRQGLQETWDWYVQNQDEYRARKNYFADHEPKS